MRISKTKNFLITILMAALSLILLFSVSCSLDDKTGGGGVSPTSPEADSGGSGTGTESGTGSGGGSGSGTGGESGTGSTPGVGDALVNSVPSPKGSHVTSARFYSNMMLTLDFNESDLLGNYPGTKEEFFESQRGKTNFTLGITNGVVTFRITEIIEGTKTTNPILLNVKLYKNGDIYNAGESEKDNDEGYTSSSKYYIEFKSADGNTLTNFKYVAAFSEKGTYTNETMETVSVDAEGKLVWKQQN